MDNVDILIIRSTSNQHLALALRRLRREYPQGNMDVLTHAHCVESIGELDGVRDILPYPPSQYFTPFLLPVLKKKYPVVVVPVSNLTGSGYENVLLLALRLKKEKILLCNLGGELIPLSTQTILARTFRFLLFVPIAVLGALFFLTLNLLALIRAISRQ